MDFFALKLKQFISRGGGSIIFGKTDLKTLELDTPFVEGTIETTGLKIGDIYFLQIYRPPSGNKDNFVEILSTYLDTLGGRKLVIGGDFNLNSSVKNKWLEKLCNNYKEFSIARNPLLVTTNIFTNFLICFVLNISLKHVSFVYKA